MSEKTFVIRLEVPRLNARWALVALFMTLGTGDLASESVTLTTYYPAPSGVYTQMITTDNTWLARDTAGSGVSVGTTQTVQAGDKMIVMGGNVGIGTTDPANMLQVTGTGNNSIDINVNGRIMTGDANNNGGVYVNNQAGAGALFVGDVTPGAGGVPTIGFWAGGNWRLNVNNSGNVGIGTVAPGARLDVQGGNFRVSGQADIGSHLIVRVGSANCNPIGYTANQAGICGGGYVTNVSGVFAKYIALGGDSSSSPQGAGGDGTALCCSCPAGGCPNIP